MGARRNFYNTNKADFLQFLVYSNATLLNKPFKFWHLEAFPFNSYSKKLLETTPGRNEMLL